MTNEDEIEDRIAKYMVGELSQVEEVSFLKEVEENPALEERLKTHQMVVESIKNSEREKLRNQLREYVPLAKKKKRNPYLVAASIIIPLLGVWIWNFGTSQDEVDLEPYFFPYKGISVTRGTNQVVEGIWLYKKANYQEAIPLFRQNLSDTALQSEYLLLLGNSFLFSGNLDSAAYYFKSLKNEKKLSHREAGNWYLALTYFKQGRKEEAKDIMMTLAAGKGVYSHYAQEFLTKTN